VALRFILVLVVATSSLLLLYLYLGTRGAHDSTGSLRSFSEKMSEARSICTDRYGTEKDQNKQLSECSSQCLQDAVGDAAQQCLVSCRKKTETFGNCLLEQSTSPAVDLQNDSR
jgi:hypothetical protein